MLWVYHIPYTIYIYTGVIHVWYIRCDSSGVIEMPPPASRQASPAIQQRGPGPPDPRSAAWAPRCWMAGLAWRLAGGGISITPDESHLMYHT